MNRRAGPMRCARRSESKSDQKVVSVSTIGFALPFAQPLKALEVDPFDHTLVQVLKVLFQIPKSADWLRHQSNNDLAQALAFAQFICLECCVSLFTEIRRLAHTPKVYRIGAWKQDSSWLSLSTVVDWH